MVGGGAHERDPSGWTAQDVPPDVPKRLVTMTRDAPFPDAARLGPSPRARALPGARRPGIERAAPVLGSVLLAVGVGLVGAGPASAFTLNAIQLDNGTCVQNLQLGSDPTASSTDTPSFLLTGDGPLSSYRFSIDGTVIGTFDADADGNVCIDDTTALGQGAHQLTGQELAPHPADLISPFSFTVDTVPLAPPSEPVLDPVTDSGVKGDDITNYSTLRLDGTSVPSVPIRILENGRLVGGAMASSTGNWTAMTDPLPAGGNVLSAATVNEAGVQSAPSPAVTVTIITTPPPAPPAPTLDPASGSGGSATVPDPTIDGTGAPAGDTITVLVDGADVGTTLSDPSGNWRDTLPIMEDGSYSVTATATDVAANTSAPSVPLALTVVSATVPGAPTLSATAGNGLVALSWSVATDGGSPVSAYDVYRGTSPGAETLLGAVTDATDSDTTVTNGITYYYEVSAINDVGPGPLSNEVEATPAAPGQAPAITSSPAVTARIRHAVSFTVTATGFPDPTFSESGSLPRGMSFNAVTGVLSGEARTGTKGSYVLVITATNPVGTTQQTLTVHVTKS